MRSKRASRSVSLDGRARALRAMGRKGSYTPRYQRACFFRLFSFFAVTDSWLQDIHSSLARRAWSRAGLWFHLASVQRPHRRTRHSPHSAHDRQEFWHESAVALALGNGGETLCALE